MAPELAQVAPLVPLWSTLTYSVPGPLVSRATIGCRVLVPLGSRTVVGVIVDRGAALAARAPAELKPLRDVLDGEPTIDRELLSFLTWVASYYLAPLGEVLRLALPAGLQAQERQSLRLTEAGRRVLEAQEAILRSPDAELAPRELELLRRLAPRKQGLSRKSLGASGALVTRLTERGLIALSMHRNAPAQARTDLLLELAHEPPDLGRAHKQAELLACLRAAGGRARLGDLAGAPAGARTLAYKLAARGAIKVETVEVPRDPFAVEPVEPDRRHRLTDEQRPALDALVAASRAGGGAFLLQGVTGSGKTEVYLRLIAEVLERGSSALVLVPEIALTPQLAARFRARFGNRVAVLHSGLTDAERYDQWRLIRSGAVKIAVGARSAVFAPLSQLGVVVVDEEHDGSFKQEEGVRYNARDIALLRAARNKAVAVLGSATPSLESRHGVDTGRLTRLTLSKRATPRPLPEVQVIDLRVYRPGAAGVLSAPLAQALSETLEREQQAILFLNRRGFSPFVICRSCGYVYRCEHCSVSLTHHQRRARLICHYCGFAVSVPTTCAGCHSQDTIGLLGLGTERVEQYLIERFPSARVARLDRDTAGDKGLRTILAQVSRREVDILVGTQMVTKGHDFPHVTLVGVVCADIGIHLPDFRAGERTFQLLTQVAGRAGRGAGAGRVMIQSYNADHPSIQAACGHDYEGFFRKEMAARRELGYPPAGHLVALRADGPDADQVAERARALGGRARELSRSGGVTVVGPAEAPLQRLKGRTRWLLLLKGETRPAVRRVAEALSREVQGPAPGGIRITVDIDPISLL